MFKSKFRNLYLICAVVLLVATLAGACAQPAPPPTTVAPAASPKPTVAPAPTAAPTTTAPAVKPVELRLSMIISEVSDRWGRILKPWIANIEKDTGGKVKVTPYFAGALAKESSTYQAVIDGLVDMLYVVPTGEKGRLPLTEIMMTSPPDELMYYKPSRLLWQLYTEFPEFQAEYKEVHIVSFHLLPLNTAASTKQIKTLADFKGLKLQTGATDQMSALGASATSSPAGFADAYQNISKGIADGIVCTDIDLIGYKVVEAVKYKLNNLPILAIPCAVAMNLKTWNSLPKDVQAVFDKYGGTYFTDLSDKELTALNDENKAAAIKAGIVYSSLSDADVATATKLFEPIHPTYAKLAEAKGKPGLKVLARMDELIRQYAKEK